MTNIETLIGKTAGFNDNGKCIPLFTITKLSKDGKKYLRHYDDDQTEWAPTDIFLKNLSTGKMTIQGMDNKAIQELCANRPKTKAEQLLEKQLDRAENPHKYMREY